MIDTFTLQKIGMKVARITKIYDGMSIYRRKDYILTERSTGKIVTEQLANTEYIIQRDGHVSDVVRIFHTDTKSINWISLKILYSDRCYTLEDDPDSHLNLSLL